MLEQVLTVCPEQYIIDDRILSQIRHACAEAPDAEPAAIARTAAVKSLEMLGVTVDSGIQQEIGNRIEYIQRPLETYDRATVDTQVEQIGRAVLSGRSETRFMKAARAGLRQGALYAGESLNGQLDLTDIVRQKQALLE
jgi:hypothetical protein